jgi:hypothetical protein
MTKPYLLCNLSGGRVLIKGNSKDIWREVSLIPRSMRGHHRAASFVRMSSQQVARPRSRLALTATSHTKVSLGAMSNSLDFQLRVYSLICLTLFLTLDTI